MLAAPVLQSATSAGRTTVLPRRQKSGEANPVAVAEQRARFEHVRTLGQGAMGQVELARDNDIRRTVAVKRVIGENATAAALMRFADEGHLPKQVLANLLTLDQRQRFLNACTQVERQYTQECTASTEPCLESGCSVAGGNEICLQPILRAGIDYHRGCAAEWLKLFRDSRNRVDAWQN